MPQQQLKDKTWLVFPLLAFSINEDNSKEILFGWLNKTWTIRTMGKLLSNKFINEEGLTLTVNHPCCKDEDCIPILGGNGKNPSWEEYVNGWKQQYQPHLLLLKKAIEELGWVGETGESIANYYCFHFSDGVKIGFSWRAWGDLMQAIVDKREGYMKYYM